MPEKKQKTEEGHDATQTQDIAIRYSNAELLEFKELITKKLQEYKDELTEELKIELTPDLHYADRKVTASNRSNLQTKILDLESALFRIENRSYGICTITRQLIPKERLRLQLTATFTVVGAQQASKQIIQPAATVVLGDNGLDIPNHVEE